MTTSTRLRLLLTAPCRKIDFQTWVSVRAFHPLLKALSSFCTDSTPRPLAEAQEGLRVAPLTRFLLERSALVDEHLSVIGESDLDPLERARRRSLEVDPGHVEAAPVAGAFELVLGGQPVRRAAEMGADRG